MRVGKRPKISGGNAAQRRRMRRYRDRWDAAMRLVNAAFKDVFGKLNDAVPEFSVLAAPASPGRPHKRDYVFPVIHYDEID
jgi:hypothetical protein